MQARIQRLTLKQNQKKEYGMLWGVNLEHLSKFSLMVIVGFFFYKRQRSERWLEPEKVIFQDGKVIFVRHGSVFVRESPNRLCKIDDYPSRTKKEEMKKTSGS